ncbi:MAG: hypothetical protein Q7T19_15740 [Caulobacter sp.]|nr:hypothetical protein [Caulobacter sp.]
MSDELAAIVVTAAVGGGLTEEGHVVLVFDTAEGRMALAIRPDLMPKVLEMVARAHSSQPPLGQAAEQAVITASTARVGIANNGSVAVLQFQIMSGGAVNIAMERQDALTFSDAIKGALDPNSIFRPPGPVN